MPKKCEVIAERVSLVVSKGSVVIVDDRQFEIAKQFLKPLNEAKVEKPVVEDKPAVIEMREEEKPLEKEVKSKKKKK